MTGRPHTNSEHMLGQALIPPPIKFASELLVISFSVSALIVRFMRKFTRLFILIQSIKTLVTV